MSEKPLSVLLIDDDFHTRELFSLAFTFHGNSLQTATTAKQALEYLKTHTPDVVVVDLIMPDINGFATLEALRQLPTSAQMRFVATTAYHTSDTVHDVFAHGFHGFLPKPFRIEELINNLRNMADHAE